MTGLSGYLLGAGAIIIAFAATFVRGWLSGAKLERQKQAGAELASRDIADQVDNDIGALPGSKAREDLRKWGR